MGKSSKRKFFAAALSYLLPDTVEYVAVGINPKHDIFHGCVVDERALGVDEEDVGDPDLLHKTRIEGAALVAAGGERQPVVLPVVPQVQRHGEVLNNHQHVEVEQDGDEQS